MFDVERESPIPLTRAASACERLVGKRVSKNTYFRWAAKGLHGVRLEVVSCGGTLCTSRQAVARFVRAVTEARQGVTTAAPAAVPAVPDAAEAERELDRWGIK